MRSVNLKTPLIAAFFLGSFLGACSHDNNDKRVENNICTTPTTAVAVVQGSAPTSTLVGQVVTVQGIVTLIENGQGAYIEEPGSDNDDRTSNALFVQLADWNNRIQAGSHVSVRGTVTEIEKGRNSLTALNKVESLSVCASKKPLPLSSVKLPLTGLEREAVEGMRIELPQALTVIDNYNLNKGQVSVAGNGFQFVATEIVQPGEAASEHARNNRNYQLPIQLQKTFSSPDKLSVGSSFNDLSGIMVHDDRELRLSMTSQDTGPVASQFDPFKSLPDVMDEKAIRAVSMNLLNYFNGDGQGGGFPTARGAKTAAEFGAQRNRIGAALKVLKPQLVAVMEIENDGFDKLSAAADFISLLNQEVGGDWQVARPEHDNTGSDAITVGLFYRADQLQTIGAARTLTGPEFKRSRQPLAQVFKPVEGGEPLLLAVNHFKSKGSCPDSGPDADQKDGQGCWNPMRTATAQKMSAWVNSLATANQVENVMITGDMNAYRNEDPINVIRSAGYEEVMDGQPSFSYVYYGEAGTLDYAFVSPALKNKVQKAFVWHSNSIMPARVDLPQPWMRFSDHDSVVVDLLIRH